MKFMYSCQEVSRIVAESIDKPLPLGSRVQLWMHLGMCGLCKKFRRALLRVDREVKRTTDDEWSEISTVKLPAEVRKRIQQRLDS